MLSSGADQIHQLMISIDPLEFTCPIVEILAVAAGHKLAVQAHSGLVQRHEACEEAGRAEGTQQGVPTCSQRRLGCSLQVQHHKWDLQDAIGTLPLLHINSV